MIPGLMHGLMGGKSLSLVEPTGGETHFHDVGVSSGATTRDIPIASYAAGDLVFIVLTASGSSQTITKPSGWTEVHNVTGGGNLRRSVLWWRVFDGSEGGVATYSVSADSLAVALIAGIRGGATELLRSSLSNTSGSSIANGSLTGPAGHWFRVGSAVGSGPVLTSTPSGYSALAQGTRTFGINGHGYGLAHLAQVQSSETSDTWSLDGSYNHVGYTLGIN